MGRGHGWRPGGRSEVGTQVEVMVVALGQDSSSGGGKGDGFGCFEGNSNAISSWNSGEV